jgi:hypothetical protein
MIKCVKVDVNKHVKRVEEVESLPLKSLRKLGGNFWMIKPKMLKDIEFYITFVWSARFVFAFLIISLLISTPWSSWTIYAVFLATLPPPIPISSTLLSFFTYGLMYSSNIYSNEAWSLHSSPSTIFSCYPLSSIILLMCVFSVDHSLAYVSQRVSFYSTLFGITFVIVLLNNLASSSTEDRGFFSIF